MYLVKALSIHDDVGDDDAFQDFPNFLTLFM